MSFKSFVLFIFASLLSLAIGESLIPAARAALQTPTAQTYQFSEDGASAPFADRSFIAAEEPVSPENDSFEVTDSDDMTAQNTCFDWARLHFQTGSDFRHSFHDTFSRLRFGRGPPRA